jgi:hypothetical protein
LLWLWIGIGVGLVLGLGFMLKWSRTISRAMVSARDMAIVIFIVMVRIRVLFRVSV